MAAATSAGEGNTDEGYAFYTEQLRQQEQQQQQQQQYQANMYYTTSTDYSTQYTDPTAAAAMTTTGGYYDANTAYSLQQKQNQNTSVLGESSAVVETSRGDDVSRKRARSATPQESSDEEDRCWGGNWCL
ncbi:hypothetical protein TcBrA4_0086990 [Trypanosoma cruzi]|nr:hypothetical protein TcBrA4_0086990 [Trypanosoma cruzi]